MSTSICKEMVPGLRVARLVRTHLEEWVVTAAPIGRDDLSRLIGDARRVAREAGATIVAEDIFGISSTEPAAVAAVQVDGERPDWPVTWLVPGPHADSRLAGVQVHAVKGVAVERIEKEGRVVGSVFDDGFARHCRLGDLRPLDASAPPDQQASATFELTEAALGAAGMDFSNVVRTWFYLDRIHAWYGSFNRVRNEFFRERKVFDGLVPASTGIGGANAARAGLIANAHAIRPRDGGVKIRAVPSPLQCTALAYGSSFSRAIEVEMPDHRRLWISGTASIAADGKTAHAGDLAAQIDLTMKVVAAILESRGLNWRDATRVVVYMQDERGAGRFQDYCAGHGLDCLPVVISENDICREELLFEIEVDAGRQLSRGH